MKTASNSHFEINEVPRQAKAFITNRGRGLRRACVACFFLPLLLVLSSAQAQLFTNLVAFSSRLPVGDPTIPAQFSTDGPKGIATADFNNDGKADLVVANLDGTVTLFYGRGDGRFGSPAHLQTGAQELRGILATDLTGDGAPDIVVASPYAGSLFLFVNQGGAFGVPVEIPLWIGARDLAAGDFDGDGLLDLAVVGTTNGLRQLRNEGGTNFVTVTNLASLSATNKEFPKPDFFLRSFRPPGAWQDELAVTHADSDVLWVLAADTNGVLDIRASITNQQVHALDIGTITQHTSSTGQLDLVTASRDNGTIEVRTGNAGPSHFDQNASQKILVPGGPRAVAIADLDGDGWNDLAVVLRNFDRVLTYHNSNGVLVASTEMPVGRSPRELVTARFNGDDHPDVAVINRDSADVSILLTYPGQTGFTTSDQIYPVDGEVTGLAVFDFNHDGRDDVIQLHRASGDFSVRLAETNGLLGPPTFYSMGSLPSAQSIVDVNNDGVADIVTANLGRPGVEPGSVSVRLGDGQGGFGVEQRYYLPTHTVGNLFALVAADFDKDGNIDLAAGFFDCRLAFFKGNGDGSFTFTRAHQFVYEARVMVAGDFDKDGDIDIAGAGYAGDVVVIENKGDLLTTDTLTRTDYRATSSKKFGTRDIVAADINGDGDLDLIVGSGDGTMLFLGAEGMSFFRASDKLPGTDFPASAVAVGDFDGDGSRDVAVSCKLLSCVSILTQDTNGEYRAALSVDVPAGSFLASGDLDGDGKADLIGSGSVLWTALSSRRSQPTPPMVAPAARSNGATHPVINELLAINTGLPLDQDQNRNSDWVELFNGSPVGLSLNGWHLRLVATNDTGGFQTNLFTFPSTAFFSSKAHLLLIFSETRRTIYHTGFRLPGGGAVISLLNPAGTEVDRVEYPAQLENVSYARFRDGLPALVYNPYPSPGDANTDNGPVDPVVKLEEFNLSSAQPDQPVRFDATGHDAVGIVSLSLVWQRRDVPDTGPHRVVLYDDGMHEDAGSLDGHFSGLLQPSLPAGGEIEFYLEATDLSGQTITLPSEAVLGNPSQAAALYSLAIGIPKPSIEISEVLAGNRTGLQDERGEFPDWVEVRNCSSTPVSLRGMSVARTFFGTSGRYAFGDNDSLNPGEHRVIYCDNKAALAGLHAPFVLSVNGDGVALAGTATNGSRYLIDSVAFGPQTTDVAWARLGCGGSWFRSAPTPRAPNVPGSWLGLVSTNGADFTLAFPTTTNANYTVEFSDSLKSSWTSLPPIQGDGTEKLLSEPKGAKRFYRVKKE